MKEMPVSNIKALFEQFAEKFGANPNVQVIQGNVEDVIAQLRAEMGEVAEVVGTAAQSGKNAVEQLIADLNAQFVGDDAVHLSHRTLSIEELEAELQAMLSGDLTDLEEDNRELQELSREELYQLIQLQDETLDLSQVALEHMRDQFTEQNERIVQLETTIDLQSQLLENSNAQLTAMHEGVANLNGLLETLRSAEARTRAAPLTLADVIASLAKR